MELAAKLYYFGNGVFTSFLFWAGYSVLSQPGLTRIRRTLGWVMIVWGILGLKELILYPFDHQGQETYLARLMMMTDTLAVPACALFLMELLTPGWITVRRSVAITLPMVVLIIGYALTDSPVWFETLFIYDIIFSAVVVVYLCRAAVRYRRSIVEGYSNTENLDIRWLLRVTAIMVWCLAVWVVSCIYISRWLDCLYIVSGLALWLLIYYYGNRQKSPAIKAGADTVEPVATPTEETSTIGSKLDKVMNVDHIYLDPDLTLIQLAKAIGSNRTHLSRYLNSELHVTFYDYINTARIDHAIALIEANTSKQSIADICSSSGFSSRTTFTKFFKLRTGVVPSKYTSRNNVDNQLYVSE